MNLKKEIKIFLKKKQFEKRIEKLAKKYENKKIMFYGAGLAFEAVNESYNLSGLNIIGIADKKFEDGGLYKGYPKFSSNTFLNQKPDVVLINLLETEIAENFFTKELFTVYGKFKYEPLIKINAWDYLTEFFF